MGRDPLKASGFFAMLGIFPSQIYALFVKTAFNEKFNTDLSVPCTLLATRF